MKLEKLGLDSTKHAVDKWCEKGLDILKDPKVQEEMEKWPAPPQKMLCMKMKAEGDMRMAVFRDFLLPIIEMLRAYQEHTYGEEMAIRGSPHIQAGYPLSGINTKNQEVSGKSDFAMALDDDNHLIQPEGSARPFINFEIKLLEYLIDLFETNKTSATGWGFIEGAAKIKRLEYGLQQLLHYCLLSHIYKPVLVDGASFIVACIPKNDTYKLDTPKIVDNKKVNLVSTFPKLVDVTVVPFEEGALVIILGLCWQALLEEREFKQMDIKENKDLRELLLKQSKTAALEMREHQEREKEKKAAKALENQAGKTDNAAP